MKIGDMLKAARGKRTIGAIASSSGIDKGYLSKVERNERNPKPDMIRKLAEAYNMPYNALMASAGYLYNADDDNARTLAEIRDILNGLGFELGGSGKNGQLEISGQNGVIHRIPEWDLIANYAAYDDTSKLTLEALLGAASESEYPQNAVNPDILMIMRAGEKLSPSEAEQLRKYAQLMFPDAFD